MSLEKVGVTDDGKDVVSGIFFLHDTHGLPLSVSFYLCDKKNMIPSPAHFIKNAREHGWKDKTIESRFREAFSDTFGDSVWKEREEKFQYLLKTDEK